MFQKFEVWFFVRANKWTGSSEIEEIVPFRKTAVLHFWP